MFTLFFYVEDCSIGLHLFEKVQDLPTRGAVGVEHFTIDGNLFLAFANHHGDIKKHKTSSMMYKMDNSTGRLSLYQTLQTRGAYDLEYFSIANKHFLAVANYYDGTHRLDSKVYQWNGNLFVDFQKLSTNGASHFTYFKILGEKYLAVANYRDGSTYSTKSVIYKWSSGKFLVSCFCEPSWGHKKTQDKFHDVQDGQLNWKIVFVPDPTDKRSV